VLPLAAIQFVSSPSDLSNSTYADALDQPESVIHSPCSYFMVSWLVLVKGVTCQVTSGGRNSSGISWRTCIAGIRTWLYRLPQSQIIKYSFLLGVLLSCETLKIFEQCTGSERDDPSQVSC
jgi:hypothetical protein